MELTQDETGIFSEFAPPELESAPEIDSSEGKDDPIETGPQIFFSELRAEVDCLKRELELQKTRVRNVETNLLAADTDG